MFVIAGITGQTGAAAAEALLARGQRVRAPVRDLGRAAPWAARGVELVQSDVADAERLAAVLDGAEGAYMLAPPDLAHPDPVGSYAATARAVAAASRKAGLARLVFLSSEGAHLPSGTGPIRGLHEAEAILAGAVPTLTFLRATFFQENWRPVFGLAAEQGILPTMLDPLDRPRTMVATRDIGRVAAELLLETAPPAIVELSGPEPYSANDVAQAVGRALGRQVAAVQPPREAWVATLQAAGLGEAYATLIAEMYDGINAGHVRFSGQAEARSGTTGLSDTLAGWTAAKAA
ncbi:MAG: NmrA family NAD(P)-binding protein [Methylobacteriaceae bacterium]|nr:NmrA family NAD(P)-binding protein [Methylobacteriaceae bacterium]